MGFQVFVIGNLAHDDEIILVVHQALHHAGAVGEAQLGLHVRIILQKMPQKVRHKILGGGHHGQLQRPFDLPFHLLHRALQLGHPAENVHAGLVHRLAGGGRENFLAHLLKQGQLHLNPQPLYLNRYSRLREM